MKTVNYIWNGTLSIPANSRASATMPKSDVDSIVPNGYKFVGSVSTPLAVLIEDSKVSIRRIYASDGSYVFTFQNYTDSAVSITKFVASYLVIRNL